MRPLLLLLVLSTTACRSDGAQLPTKEKQAAQVRLHDLTPTFWRFWDGARDQPGDEVLRRLQSEVIAAHPEVYTAHVLGLDEKQPFSQALGERWVRFLAFAERGFPRAREISSTIARDLPAYDATFREAFPDFAYDGDVYFLVSLGGFDGAVRKVNGRDALLFGVDIMAVVQGEEADVASFFHHELFHIYHRQVPTDGLLEGRFVHALWSEGLAVYVASRLNPGASEAALLGLPKSTPARVRADLPRLAGEARKLLSSEDPADYARWFTGSAEDQAIPSRAGYTLGYLVAQELHADEPLQDFVMHNRGVLLAAKIHKILEKWEKQAPPSSP